MKKYNQDMQIYKLHFFIKKPSYLLAAQSVGFYEIICPII